MSNKTQAAALSVRGQNPQNLIEAIVRQKIYQNRYWKEKLPGLTAASIIDEALELEYVGGTYGGNRKPSKFMMLSLKLLQISPEKAEIMEYIIQEDYKYLTALGCFHLRLMGQAEDIYKSLEPLYQDYRKLRFRNIDGSFSIVHMDEFIDGLLTQEVYLDTLLPHIPKRFVLEENNVLKPRVSPLEELLQEELKKEEEMKVKMKQAEEEAKRKAQEESKTRMEEEGGGLRESKDGDDHKKKSKKHRRHSSSGSSRSSSSDRRHKKSSKHSKSSRDSGKHRDWRKVVKGRYHDSKRSHLSRKSESRSPSPKKKHQKEPEKDSVEYWNQIRAQMGIDLI